MATEMPKAYEAGEVERRIYEYWLREGVCDSEPDATKEPFCIVIPPPNVTGVLHMGHALDNAIQDLLVRWRRMLGYGALWLPGTDHAGIATQNVTEKLLAEEGLTRHDLGREEFVKRVWEVKTRHHGHIVQQLKRLGGSMDWRRERFTLDAQCARAVREAFVTLYERGLIYRGAYMVNWCPRCATGLSDLEVEHADHAGKLWYIRYPQADGGPGLVVATTRPETMLGDTAVAVHPNDPRYQSLIGKTLRLPLMEREIPVVADEAVDPEFGTGAVKVTPAHDPNDLAIASRHSLPSVVVIAEDGTMTAETRQYAGLDRYECRRQVVADLEARGLLERIEDHAHSVGHCQRCDTVVEPLVSTQWFLRMAPLAEKGLAVVRSGEVRFVPERWAKVYTDWLENIRDWPISRQLWWGHPIPVWYCDACENMVCSREDPSECPHCGGPLRPDPDVLDTWFSSALWPFSTLGWPEQTPEMDYWYPTSVLVTGYDIIFFWVARMIMMGMELVGEKPFHEVFIHGLVRDEKGRKISKSLGNNIDPIELIDKYGADALRFALIQLITHGQDLTYHEDRLVGARNFCNKLWNASRFVIMNLAERAPAGLPPNLSLADRWILSRQASVLAEASAALRRYDLARAAELLYEYVWTEFCDWYVELSKTDLYGDDPVQAQRARWLLEKLLSGILRSLHPFMPFITEEIWQRLYPGAGPIALQAYPVADETHHDPEAEAAMAMVVEVTNTIRSLRMSVNLPPQQRISVAVRGPAEDLAALRELEPGVRALARLAEIQYLAPEATPPDGALAATARGVEVFLPLAGMLDPAVELKRLDRRLTELAGLCEKVRSKLANEKFVANAKPEVVQGERDRLREYEAEWTRVQEQKRLFEGML